MSHIRDLKPEFFTDEDISNLEPLVRLFFQGLWTQADRQGRLPDRPKQLKTLILPYDTLDPNKALKTLAEPKEHSGKPFIYRYIANNCKYIQIVNWNKHQKPHNSEVNSIIPLSTEVYSMLYSIDKKDNKHSRHGATQLKLENGFVSVRKPLEILKGLKLYENYPQLLKRLPEMIPIWKQSCPGVNIELEIKKAHAWELENTKKRKIDKIKFLGAWMRRCQDRGGGYRQNTEQPKASQGKYEKFK